MIKIKYIVVLVVHLFPVIIFTEIAKVVSRINTIIRVNKL